MATLKRHILLIGLRASGKTTLARALAQRLGAAAIDLDDEALRALGAPDVETAWRTLGEPVFRAAERDALERALASPAPAIIAAGGGAPTAPGAELVIRAAQADGRAIVVYLRCAPSTLRDRLRALGGAGADRPSLTGGDPLDEIEAVFARRDPLYRALADVIHQGDAIPATAEGAERAADEVRTLIDQMI